MVAREIRHPKEKTFGKKDAGWECWMDSMGGPFACFSLGRKAIQAPRQTR